MNRGPLGLHSPVLVGFLKPHTKENGQEQKGRVRRKVERGGREGGVGKSNQ